MSQIVLPIYNSRSYDSGNLTKEEADKFYYRKSDPNLTISGNEIVNNDETVYGTLTASQANITNAITAGQTNTSHTFSGTVNITKSLLLSNVCTFDNILGNTSTFWGPINFLDTTKFVTNTQIGKLDKTNVISVNGTIGINGQSTFDTAPLSSSTASNASHLTNKTYVDTAITTATTNLKAASNTWTDANTFNNGLTVANCFSGSASGISFSFVPTLQGNYSQPTGNCLSTKNYVDTQLSGITSRDTFYISYGCQTYQSGVRYYFAAPNLGNNTTADTGGITAGTVYINFPTNVDGPNTCLLSFNWNIQQGSQMTASVTVETNPNQNQISRVTPFGDNEIFNNQPVNSSLGTSATIQVSTTPVNGSVFVKALQQTTVFINNSTTSNVNNYSTIGMTYNGVSMKCIPIIFDYIDSNKIRGIIRFPKQDNNPSKVGWLSSCTASLRVLSGDGQAMTVGQNSTYLSLT